MAIGDSEFRFDQATITSHAPRSSGVYAVYVVGQNYVYVGESGDVQARLLHHLGDPTHCIHRYAPLGFTFELLAAEQRLARLNELIATLRPSCNQEMG